MAEFAVPFQSVHRGADPIGCAGCEPIERFAEVTRGGATHAAGARAEPWGSGSTGSLTAEMGPSMLYHVIPFVSPRDAAV